MMQEKNESLHQYEGEKERGGNMHVNTGFPFFMNVVNIISSIPLMLNKS
jgi:hypothetical protein